jgi:hypothetical protein
METGERPWRARVLEGVEPHPDCWPGPGHHQTFKPRRAVKSRAKTMQLVHENALGALSQSCQGWSHWFRFTYQRDVVSCAVR